MTTQELFDLTADNIVSRIQNSVGLTRFAPARARIPSRSYIIFSKLKNTNINIMALKPGPKRTATSTGKPDQRQRDNKKTHGNTPSLKPSKSTTKK
jgi:hypothetical protein